MIFSAKGEPFDQTALQNAADLLQTGSREIWTVLLVETSGFGYLQDRRPRILFERHYFHRLTGGAYDATAPDISNPDSGGYSGGAAEYDRLQRALQLDESAALQSASWGIGQIMGENYPMLGYGSVQDMVSDFVQSESAQLLGMARFVQSKKLTQALQQQRWADFALGYNGSAYQKNQYDVKLGDKYNWLGSHAIDLILRRAQTALLYLGYKPGGVDGIAGNNTRNALLNFQQAQGLAQSGTTDDATCQQLDNLAF